MVVLSMLLTATHSLTATHRLCVIALYALSYELLTGVYERVRMVVLSMLFAAIPLVLLIDLVLLLCMSICVYERVKMVSFLCYSLILIHLLLLLCMPLVFALHASVLGGSRWLAFIDYAIDLFTYCYT